MPSIENLLLESFPCQNTIPVSQEKKIVPPNKLFLAKKRFYDILFKVIFDMKWKELVIVDNC